MMATQQDATEPVRITSEEQAFEVLQRALADEFADANVRLNFDGWPVLTIELEGEGYQSTITAPMAEGLVQLQRAMNRAYAQLVKGTGNATALTNEEKASIQFKAKVDDGSSLITVNVANFAEKVALATVGKMTSTDLVITIVSLAAIAGSTVAYRAFLKARSDDKKVELETQARIALSENERARQEHLTNALTRVPRLRHVSDDFDDARTEILKGVADAKSIELQGTLLTNAEARTLASTTRQRAEEVRLDGVYYIHRIDWSRPDEARLTLVGQEAQAREFVATLGILDLRPAHKAILQSAEWERRTLHLTINATQLRGDVTTARIVGVAWPQSPDDSGEKAPPSKTL